MKDSAVVAAVIVIDMQRAFVEGQAAIPLIGTVLRAVRGQIEAARAAGALVVHLQNDGGAGEPDQPGSPGWELVLEPEPGDAVVRKGQDDGFVGTDLDALLDDHHVTTISICGVMSEMCVAATARSAMERGFEVVLAHDAHGTYPVPALTDGEAEVPAELAARVAEWSLGDDLLVPATSESVRFQPATPGQAVVQDRRGTGSREKHSRSVPGGRGFWWSERLWEESAGLPVVPVPITDIAEFDENCWFGEVPPTCREVAEHARRIEAADLRHPVILSAEGGLMDGGHRIARAWLDGRSEVDAVRFVTDPAPDWVEPTRD